MKSIVLTLDYELYGNGSGNVFQHIIAPTEKILQLAGKYNAKITIFFEIVEYWKLKKEWETGNSMGYQENPIEAIEQQLKKAYSLGHDIQLHIHPQWVDAKWINDHWTVNLNEWRLGDYKKEGEFSLVKLLSNGKASIESIIQEVDRNYRCTTLRAGGYNIQPSHEIVKAMKAAGLMIDSSIYPGGKETGSLSNYDYSNIPLDLDKWETGSELEEQGHSQIFEYPIVAFPIIRLSKYLNIERIKSLLQNKNSAKQAFEAKTSGNLSNSKFQKIKYFFEKEFQTWDFCLFSPRMHKKYLSLIEKQNKDTFVLVGHPKSLVSTRGFEFLLEQTHTKFNYKRFKDYAN